MVVVGGNHRQYRLHRLGVPARLPGATKSPWMGGASAALKAARSVQGARGGQRVRDLRSHGACARALARWGAAPLSHLLVSSSPSARSCARPLKARISAAARRRRRSQSTGRSSAAASKQRCSQLKHPCEAARPPLGPRPLGALGAGYDEAARGAHRSALKAAAYSLSALNCVMSTSLEPGAVIAIVSTHVLRV